MDSLMPDLASDVLALPPPALPAVTLEQALKARHSTREFDLARPLPLALVSPLLWAAFGVNRDGGGRTAPSARDWQEVDVYALFAEGAYRYDAHSHRLLRVKAADLRGLSGLQDFPATVPLDLVYVADLARMTGLAPSERDFFVGADAAFVAQNVYLCCAAAGLATVVRAMIDRRALAQALGLAATQRIALAQSVGWPVA